MYTKEEYTSMAMQANQNGMFLYVLVDRETNDETLTMAPMGYYDTFEGIKTYGDINQEYASNQLKDRKIDIMEVALLLARTAITEGYIVYRDLEIETTSNTLVDLTATKDSLYSNNKNQTIWIDRNDKLGTLTIDDIEAVISKIAEHNSAVWFKYYNIINSAKEASTIEELEAIDTDFTKLGEVDD